MNAKEVARITVETIELTNEISDIVSVYLNNKVTLTNAQKQVLLNKYLNLRTQIIDKVQEFPE